MIFHPERRVKATRLDANNLAEKQVFGLGHGNWDSGADTNGPPQLFEGPLASYAPTVIQLPVRSCLCANRCNRRFFRLVTRPDMRRIVFSHLLGSSSSEPPEKR
jgi:hypothetical protein